MILGFPGMHVKPLVPSRKMTTFPRASVSTMRADLAISDGPADIARAILTWTDSASSAKQAVANIPKEQISRLIRSPPYVAETESVSGDRAAPARRNRETPR